MLVVRPLLVNAPSRDGSTSFSTCVCDKERSKVLTGDCFDNANGFARYTETKQQKYFVRPCETTGFMSTPLLFNVVLRAWQR